MDLNTRFERSADLMVAEMDGDMVMMDVEQGSYFAINPVGAHIWTQLETPQTLDDLVAGVKGSFDNDDTAQIQSDAEQFLTQLVEQNLVKDTTG